MSTSLPTLTPLAQSIANAEGFGASANNIPTLANNPGDLENGDVGYGTITASGGNQITVYGSLAEGAQALENQVAKIFNGTSAYYSPDMSLSDFGTTYSGGNTNYGTTLANSLGVSPSTTLAQVQNGASASPASSSGAGTLASNAATGLMSSLNPFSGFSISRIILLILGIISFGAGLLAFKQTQDIIETGTGVVKTGAKVVKNVASSGGEVAAL